MEKITRNKAYKFVAQVADFTGSFGVHGTRPELVDAETWATANCTLVNYQLEMFIRFAYKRTDKGNLMNLQNDGQIPKGIWTPWGAKGQLTRAKSDITRRYLLSLNNGRPPRPLFFYLADKRHWYVDLLRYATLDEALEWLQRYAITPQAWIDLDKDKPVRKRRKRKPSQQ